MAVGQAADAFRIFTGRDADPERMRAHFLELVGAEVSRAEESKADKALAGAGH
ncbi:shikimate dehydrogenase [Arthrobacter sp. Hiyo1]|nr:shikimate dehydrogenase [Arthrobacter sp. Hiyo1]